MKACVEHVNPENTCTIRLCLWKQESPDFRQVRSIELNPNCIEEEAGVEKKLASPLNYLEDKIGLYDESNENSYLHYLLKSWKIEKSYLLLSEKFKKNKTKEKIVKI